MQLTNLTQVCFLLIAFAVCGGNYAGAQSGNLSTPNYPSGYPDSSNCIWIIHCPYHHFVTVSLTVVSIEDDKTCAFDYLVLFDGSSPSSTELTPKKSGTYLTQNKICGEWSGLEWKSTGRSITAKFISDESTSARGFTGSWRCELDAKGWLILHYASSFFTTMLNISGDRFKVLTSLKSSALQ